MLTISRKLFYMAAGGILALIIVMGGTAVFAQSNGDPAPAPPIGQDGVVPPQDGVVPPQPGGGFGNFRGPGGPRGQVGGLPDMDSYLADALGITLEELQAAQATAREAALADAVADGRITQEQADLMTARQALRDYIDQDAILAGVLGISTDELEAAKADHTVRDLIVNSGLSPEEMRTAVQEAYEAAVAQAVADGVITQEQADLLPDAPSRGNGRFGGRPGGGHPPGGPRGGGFPGGAPNAAPNAPVDPNA